MLEYQSLLQQYYLYLSILLLGYNSLIQQQCIGILSINSIYLYVLVSLSWYSIQYMLPITLQYTVVSQSIYQYLGVYVYQYSTMYVYLYLLLSLLVSLTLSLSQYLLVQLYYYISYLVYIRLQSIGIYSIVSISLS